MIAIQLTLAILFFFLSGFFSAAETALVSLSPQKSKSLALRNPGIAPYIIRWLREPRDLLILIISGNTLCTVLVAAWVTSLAFQFFPFFSTSQIEIVGWILETVVLIIFAEMVPKFVARANPEGAAVFVLPWLFRLRKIFRPFRKFITAITTWVSWGNLRLPPDQTITFSSDEIKALLEERETGPAISFESLPMVERTLELQDRQAQNIMTEIKNVDLIEIDPPGKSPLSRELLIDLIVENGRTRTPIKFQGKIIGFIHFDDLLPLILKDEGNDVLESVRGALDVPAARRVADLLQDFKTSSVHMGFVRNEPNEIIGIVTLEDVLEEITGEILDEYDVADSVGDGNQ